MADKNGKTKAQQSQNQGKRRAIIIDPHYSPDSNPLASFWQTIAHWLIDEGVAVTVITAQPGYRQEDSSNRQPWREKPKQTGGPSIIRLPLLPNRWHRLMKYLNYPLFIMAMIPVALAVNLRYLRCRRLIMSSTVPPVILAAVCWAVARLTGGKFLYYVQDIHPEAAAIPGKDPGLLAKAALALDRFVVARSWRAVAISDDLKHTLMNRGGKRVRTEVSNVEASNIEVIENFPLVATDSQARSAILHERKSRNSHRFLFAGNLGRFQNLDALVDAFLAHDVGDAELVLVGSGAKQASLAAKIAESGSSRVRMVPFVPKEEMPAIFAAHDFGIATLQPQLIRYACPSKIATYLEFGLPVLTTVEAESALAKQLHRQHLGTNSSPNAQDIALAVKRMIKERATLMTGLENYETFESRQRAEVSWREIASRV